MAERTKNEKAKLAITLVKSPIGKPYRQKETVRGLGLRRIRQTVLRPDTPQVRGMIQKIIHLLEIREA